MRSTFAAERGLSLCQEHTASHAPAVLEFDPPLNHEPENAASQIWNTPAAHWQKHQKFRPIQPPTQAGCQIPSPTAPQDLRPVGRSFIARSKQYARPWSTSVMHGSYPCHVPGSRRVYGTLEVSHWRLSNIGRNPGSTFYRAHCASRSP